ncbi:uncharacterized protein JCM6883_005392 [Sporobolomyces salmoneus]|uniref:uncharacterized protein n=1 Tax=Sporobolomyces salmoneus TaxID=183962 RepID=UPI0031722F31
MDPINHLFALSQVHYGMHLTNHSALLRMGADVPVVESLFDTMSDPSCLWEVGMARREGMLAANRNIADAILQQHFDHVSPEQAAEQVSVWLFAINTVTGVEGFETTQLLMARNVIEECFAYLAEATCTSDVLDGLMEPLREIVLSEIHHSLLQDQTSIVTPSQYYFLFDQHPSLVFPTVPADITFVFSGAPEPAETRERAFALQEKWAVFAISLYRHLEFVLTFSPSARLSTAAAYCLKKIDQAAHAFGAAIDRILSDPRYSLKDPRRRPHACISGFIFDEASSMAILRSLYNIIINNSLNSHLLDKSRELWFDALERSASRLDWLPV